MTVLAGQQIHRAVLWIMAILAASLAFILAVLAWSERQRRNVSRLSRQASHDALTGAASSAASCWGGGQHWHRNRPHPGQGGESKGAH
ncbi:MAG: hypothetical protein U0997_03395 [Sulfurimicrobium sp.]|nr:hypothetical protein [Sulfurimicrobium sp.]